MDWLQQGTEVKSTGYTRTEGFNELGTVEERLKWTGYTWTERLNVLVKLIQHGRSGRQDKSTVCGGTEQLNGLVTVG